MYKFQIFESMKQSGYRIIAFGIVALAAVIFALWLTPFYFKSPAPSLPSAKNDASSSITFVVDASGTVSRYEISAPQSGKNSFELLRETLAENNVPFEYKLYPGMGNLVIRIGDLKNGTDSRYWQYFVNGAYVPVGADAYFPNPGDVITWQFMSYKDQ